jgi:hypothetical protein
MRLLIAIHVGVVSIKLDIKYGLDTAAGSLYNDGPIKKIIEEPLAPVSPLGKMSTFPC